jgi:hypothetical protein
MPRLKGQTKSIFMIPISLVLPSWFLILLIRNIANTVDVTAINAAVRKVRSYGDGGGYERLKKE